MLPLIEELGIDVAERVITFVQQNEVWCSEIYCIAYLDAYLIEQLNYVVSDKEFGLGIELAPTFVDQDSDIVDLTDAYFSNLVE